MVNSSDYKNQLLRLQPQGLAWPTDDEKKWVQLLQALAEELARVDYRAIDLVNEALPDTTTELLPDWERVAGLPDPCSGLGASVAIRRKDLLAKITARGGQSRQYFIGLAAELGYEITITEFHPFRAGISKAGDPCFDERWGFAWQVNAPETTIEYFRAGQNVAGDPLTTWGNQRLECVISARKPAHTIVLFSYT